MPNEVNLGRLVAEIALEGQEAEDTAIYIKDVLKSIGIEGKDANQVLKQCFSDTSALKKYQSQLEIIAAKIEKQKQVVVDLEKQMNKEPVVKSDYTAIEKATAAIDAERIKLTELQKKFDDVTLSQDNFVKKQAQAAEKLADKKAYKDASTGVDLMSSSLRTLDNIAPGTVSSLSDVITQVQIAKRAFHQAATPALAWGTTIAAGVGIVANLIVTGLSQIQAKQEEARRQAAQLAEEYKAESQTLRDLSDDYMTLKTKIDTASLSRDEESNAKKQLMQVQEKLIELYGKEAKGIDLINGKLDEEVDKIKTLSAEQAKQYQREHFGTHETAEKELEAIRGYYIGSLKYAMNVDGSNSTRNQFMTEIEELLKSYNLQHFDQSNSGDITRSLTLNVQTKDAREQLNKLFQELENHKNKITETAPKDVINVIDNMLATISEKIKDASNEQITDWNTEVEQWENAAEIIASNGANLFPEDKTAEYQIRSIQQYTASVNDLGSAYATLHEGQQLDLDTVLSLIDTYPQFAQAIASGTLSLSDQEAVVKSLFETKKAEALASIEADRQKVESLRDTTQETIDLLQKQIAAYAAAGGGFGGIYGQLADAQAELAQYNDQLDQLNARTKAYQSININDYLPDKKAKKKDDRNEALQQELKLLEHRKALNQLSAQDEIAWLERINSTYSKNSDEQMDMEKRLYNARKAQQEAEERAAKEALDAAIKGIENKKALGKLTTEEEINQLQRIRQTYRMNAEDAMSLEIKLYNLKKNLQNEQTDKLDNIADGVIKALENKYERQKESETKRINQSIDSWKKWENETVTAIQGQIDALDELSKAQESEEQRQEYEQKRQAAALQLAYEKDDYNRKQLQKELNRLDKEEAKRLEAEAREKQKEELQKQMDKVKEESEKQQEMLKKRQEALNKQYEKLTSSFALEQEAQKIIMQQGMNGVINLINSYAPEFNLAGKSLADKLFEGFRSHNWDIDAYADYIQKGVSAAYAKAAGTAAKAAEEFWKSRIEYDRQTGMTTAPVKAPKINLTVNFNQPVESPVETQRRLQNVAQELARQIIK